MPAPGEGIPVTRATWFSRSGAIALTASLLTAAVVGGWPATAQDPAPDTSSPAGLTPAAVDERLLQVVNLAMEAALGEASLTLLDSPSLGGFALELQVPTSIDLPLTLEAVVGDLTALLDRDPNPSSATGPSSVSEVVGLSVEEEPLRSLLELGGYDAEGLPDPLEPTVAPDPLAPATPPSPAGPTPQLEVPTQQVERERADDGGNTTLVPVTEVDPCELMLELGYLIEHEGNSNSSKICPGNLVLELDPSAPLSDVPQLIKDPINHVTSRMLWEVAEMQRALHDLDAMTATAQLDVLLTDMADRATRMEELVHGLDSQVVDAANQINDAVAALAREMNEVSSMQVDDLLDATRAEIANLQATVGQLSDRLLGGFRNLLDDLQLIPQLPTRMPLQVCARIVTADGVSEDEIAFAEYGLSDVDNADDPLEVQAGQAISLVPTGDAPDVGRFASLTCPDGAQEVAGLTSLTGVVAPRFVAAPDGADVEALLADPTSLPVGSAITVAVEIIIQTTTSLDEDGQTTSRSMRTPFFELPVTGVPVPTIGFGFTHRRPNGEWHGGSSFGTVVSTPANSAIDSAQDALDTLAALRQAIEAVFVVLFPPDPGAPETWNQDALDRVGVGGPIKDLKDFHAAIGDVLEWQRVAPNGATGDVGIAFASNDANLHDNLWINRAQGDATDDIHIGDEVRSALLMAPPEGGRAWCWDTIKDTPGVAVSGYTRSLNDWPGATEVAPFLRWFDDPGTRRFTDDTFGAVHSEYPFAGSGRGLDGNHHYDADLAIEDGVARWFWPDSRTC